MQKLRKKEEKDRVTAFGQAQSTWGPKAVKELPILRHLHNGTQSSQGT